MAQNSDTVPSKMPFLLSFLLILGAASSQAQGQRIYVDAAMSPVAKGKAVFYLEPEGEDGTGGYRAKMYNLDGTLKAKGRYADQECRIPDGHFVFYYPDGKVESEGEYENGWKNGVWTRKDKWGRDLAEKMYNADPLRNIVYTMAQTMPQYPGGEKAMVRYVRQQVGKPQGNAMASFIVEKDGQVSDVQVTGVSNAVMAEQIASAISGTSGWEAGRQDGQPVRVQMRVPIK
ncbi:MAG TPA: energy transducer TonB [Flavobacteriales bacterium]|nr:energy transducer TonB [Flavobacteriales bacterium]